MKRLLAHIALCAPAVAFAQEPWIWTQYMFNLYEANAAYVGNPEALYVSGHHRVQWVGWEGAPQMSNAMVQAPVLKGKMGVGLAVSTERIGAHRGTTAEMAAAYKIKFGANVLSFGLTGGILQQTFFPDELTARDEESWWVASQRLSSLAPQFGGGIFFNSKRFFVGLDAKNLNNPARELYAGFTAPALRQYRGVMGLAIPLNGSWVLRPSAMMRLRDSGAVSADASLCVFWQEKIWLGLSYRHQYGWAAMADWSVTRRLRIGFSADMASGAVGFLPPAQELFLGYYFNAGVNRPPSIRYF